MLNGIPWLPLRNRRDPPRMFIDSTSPDGESVTIRFQDTEGTATLGPWSLEAAKRHAARLRQAGYLATEEPTMPRALELRSELPLQERALVPSAGRGSLPHEQ